MKEVISSSSGKDDRNMSLPDVSPSRPLRKSSSESCLNELRKSHHFDSDQSSRERGDQQARTNEAPFSKLDWQSISLKDMDDNKLLHQAADHYAQGKYKDAEILYKFIIDDYEQKPQIDDHNIDLALKGIADVCKMQKRYEDADALYRFLIERYARKPQPDDIKIGLALKGIADVWSSQGKHNEANVVYDSVVSIYMGKLGKPDLKTAQAVEGLADVYKNQDRLTKAKALYEFAHSIYTEKLGENDSKTEKVRRKLADIPAKSGQGDQSRVVERLIHNEVENRLMEYIKYHKSFPDLCKPESFNEKSLHRSLLEHTQMITLFQDKYAVREYVKERIGEKYLPKLYYATTDPTTIPFEELPDKFVVKSNKGARSSGVRVVMDKSKITKSAIVEECKEWAERDYYKESGTWGFKNIEHRIIIEEFIDDGTGSAPSDYKFYTYNGKPHFVQVEADRFTDYSSTFFDMDWNRLPVTHGEGKNCEHLIGRPEHLEEMEALVGKLVEDIGFARVDFFLTSDRPIFAEITAVSGKALARFTPHKYDRIFGEPWKEVYNKCTIQSPPPSLEVFNIMRQINNGMQTLVLEGGQSDR
jgi:tetratricopeptide (TPR) repeat protein